MQAAGRRARAPVKTESYRGNPSRGRLATRQRAKTHGQILQEAAQARALARERTVGYLALNAARRRIGIQVEGRANARLVSSAARGQVMAAAGNEIIQGLFDTQRLIGEYRNQLARLAGHAPGSRRGALATRPLQSTGVPGRRGESSGPGSGPLAPAVARPGTKPGATPGIQPGPAVGVPSALPLPAPARAPAPVARPAPAPVPATRPAPRTSPFRFELRMPNLGDLLARALAPRPAPRLATAARVAPFTRGAVVTPALPTTLTRLGTPPQLTSLNSPLLGLSAQSQPQPQSEACRQCAQERKRKSSKRRCRNPLISKSRSGNVLTTRRRIVCP